MASRFVTFLTEDLNLLDSEKDSRFDIIQFLNFTDSCHYCVFICLHVTVFFGIIKQIKHDSEGDSTDYQPFKNNIKLGSTARLIFFSLG